MRLSYSPTRDFKVAMLTSGLIIEIVRNVTIFLKNYKKELDLSESIESYLKEVNSLKRKFDKLDDGKHKGAVLKKLNSVRRQLRDEFGSSSKKIAALFDELEIVSLDTDALLYREAQDILQFIEGVDSTHMNDKEKIDVVNHLFHLFIHIASTVHHGWMVSKAQSRTKVKWEEALDLARTLRQRRLVKRKALEVRALAGKLSNAKKAFRSAVSKGDESGIENALDSVISVYDGEFQDLHDILHRSKVLIHRTEKLLHTAEMTSKSTDDPMIVRDVRTLHSVVKSDLKKLQTQSLREYLDLKHQADVLSSHILSFNSKDVA